MDMIQPPLCICSVPGGTPANPQLCEPIPVDEYVIMLSGVICSNDDEFL